MYFPYFRGRQYELLALRELAQGNMLSNYIVPVVEPIKITPTFKGTIRQFTDNSKHLALILNPAVGELSRSDSAANEVLPFLADPIIPAVIMEKDTKEALEVLAAQNIQTNNILAVMTNRDFIETYRKLFAAQAPKFTLFPEERQIRRAITENKVMFEDKFTKQEKNADYLKNSDEFYSDDHLYFNEEGFIGFGDYSLIGNEYVENGFAPYAVAIHIVYFANDYTLRIRHFVSDSNTDISDVAGKYYEAVTKLKHWYEAGQLQQRTSALSTLLNHAENGYYPGLPTIKKLSIMHHLELIGTYLDAHSGGIRK